MGLPLRMLLKILLSKTRLYDVCYCVAHNITFVFVQDDAVEEKMGALISAETVAGLANSNWKERLASMEKFTQVGFCGDIILVSTVEFNFGFTRS